MDIFKSQQDCGLSRRGHFFLVMDTANRAKRSSLSDETGIEIEDSHVSRASLSNRGQLFPALDTDPSARRLSCGFSDHRSKNLYWPMYFSSFAETLGGSKVYKPCNTSKANQRRRWLVRRPVQFCQ
jgi:hypothetical protein